MNQQDIVWVKLPFSDMQESKFRPAVIVSNNEYNKSSQDVVVCAVTSNLENKKYSILIDNKNIEKGNLPVRSRVRADKIMQIEKTIIEKPFARLDSKTFDMLADEIMKLIKRG